MPLLKLAPPVWDELLGGGEEAKWLASRDRKFGLAMALAKSALDVEQRLRERDSLLHCTPEVLEQVPGAADWYIALLGLSSKMMNNTSQRVRASGLSHSPASVAAALRAGRPVAQQELEAFSRWVNADIEHLFPQGEHEAERRAALASASALMTLGARADGQNRVLGGDLGVVVVKTSLVEAMSRGRLVEVEQGGTWVEYKPEHNLPGCRRIRFGGRLVCDFTPGRNTTCRVADGFDLVVAWFVISHLVGTGLI